MMARIQRSTSQWQELIEAQKQSSLTIKEFCRQQGVTTSGFYGWRKRLKESNNGPQLNGSTDWLPIDLNSAVPSPTANVSSWDIELHLPNGVILKMSQQTC
ncbi:MAG: hypothetical protein OQK71_05090 [Desulfobacter sp.]|nr:hypothetical protein [Desulfobacter sp.]